MAISEAAVARVSVSKRRGVDLSQPLSDAAFAEHRAHVLRGTGAGAARPAADAARSSSPSRAASGRREPHVIDQFHHPDDPNILILSNGRRTASRSGSPTPERISTPTTRICRFRRARRCSTRSRSRKPAATRCSPISTRRTTTCPTR